MIRNNQYDADERRKLVVEKRKDIARIIEGRESALPSYLYTNNTIGLLGVTRHKFYFRNHFGHLVWMEVWCNNSGVIAHVREKAKGLAQCGCDVLFLPTEMSIRSIGDRQPMLVRPPRSMVDLKQIAARLRSAGFEGVYPQSGAHADAVQ